ncbi:MAG: DUF1858 domain-containing protein [Blastocatellia bacterium]|nr:DUF1858 domain-containing protein [Blastocatellia bacterium]MCX7753432.1 DUF1858 domain-containing protein [Blastocatellia bacterium]
MNERRITAEMSLPEVIRRFPTTRAVFDQYGLRGCGGPEGPRETIAWFARLHGVPLDRLLDELNAAAERESAGGEIAFRPTLADTIYRPFFLAGLLTLFTLGCVWGAVNLWLMGMRQNFAGVDYSWILAHGHAMVFGVVGFFIMGFAYQAFPRFKHTSLWRPTLAWSALPLMAMGIALQAGAHLLAPRGPFLALGLLAGALQVLAVALFAWVLRQTFRQADRPEPYDRFVHAALFWFLLAAAANPVIFWLFETARTREAFLFRVATFNIPYRDVQLLGIAVVMILGVSLRFLPHAYGLREPTPAWRRFMFWGTNSAIAIGVLAFLMGMLSGESRWLIGQEMAALLLLVIAIGTPRQYRLFGPVPESERDRGLKFIRAAYVWFIVAMAMFAFVPIYNLLIYQPLTGAVVPFSHAFFGAYRHALTVGFITMMVVGVSSKVVPTLSGVDVRSAPALWPTFWLLNVGNALRITTEVATDYTKSAFVVMGLSGFIEVVGLALWGYELVRNIRVGKRLEREALSRATSGPLILGPQTKVAEVLERHHRALDIFLRHGFATLQNPVLRRTMARVVTLEQACRREGVELERLLAELRAFIEVEQKARASSSEAREALSR